MNRGEDVERVEEVGGEELELEGGVGVGGGGSWSWRGELVRGWGGDWQEAIFVRG